MFIHEYITTSNHEHFMSISEKLDIEICEQGFAEYALENSTYEQFLMYPAEVVGNYYASKIEEALRNLLNLEEVGFIQTDGNGFYLDASNLSIEEETEILKYL